MEFILVLVAVFLFVFSLFEERFEKLSISGPILAVAFGFAIGPQIFDLLNFELNYEGYKVLAELALALVLFTDAAETNLSVLRHNLGLPTRLLLFGLPLTLLAGYFAGFWLFPGLNWIELALIATMLAPTDAALGKPVVINESVPSRIREGLKVESGLNDGICVPILFLLVALFEVRAVEEVDLQFGIYLFVEEIGIGTLVGLAAVFLGDHMIHYTMEKGWISRPWKPLVIILLAVICFAGAQLLGGSGFIAAFVGGILHGRINQKHKDDLLEAAEGTGDALGLITWFIFGVVVLTNRFQHFTWEVMGYALLSLTLIRMLPVVLVLLGSRYFFGEKLFIGWFGPRGLASIVFVLIVMELELPHEETVVATVVCTVLFSVILHGITSHPFVSSLIRSEERHEQLQKIKGEAPK